MSKVFSLETNPFFVLRADYKATRSRIAELVEDAIFDRDGDEGALADAQQQLVSPNQRLMAEISFLPELSEAQTNKTVQSVESDEILASWRETVHFPELARANIMAHVAASGPADFELISALIGAWADLEPDDALAFIGDKRNLAGFPPPDSATYHIALSDLRDRHAAAAAEGVRQAENPGQLMTSLVERYAETGDDTPLLAAMVAAYDRATEGDLARIGEALEACAVAIETAPKDSADEVAKIPGLLAEWDDINQPVQLYEQARGHEEARSKRISNRLRAVCIALANDHDEYNSASIISKALLHTFPELESIAEQLRDDVSELEQLRQQYDLDKELSGLAKAAEDANENLKKFAKVLKSAGVSPSSPFPVGQFIKEFRIASGKQDVSDVSWKFVRFLALSLNNDGKDPWASWFFIDSMTSKFGASLSASMRAQLSEDKRAAYKNWKFSELENAKSPRKSQRLIDDLLKYATPEEAAQLKALRSRLVRHRIGRWVKAFPVLAFVVVGVGAMILEGLEDNSRSSYSTSTSRTTRSLPNTSLRDSGTSTARNSSSSTTRGGATETRPVAGLSRALTRAEIRYCVYQGERIDYLRPMINTYENYQVDRFNALISDLNARCGSYRYYESDMSAVKNELIRKSSTLRADARRILESW